jgi:proline iminopeptidase
MSGPFSRAVLLDQRGSGRSRPPANEPDADLNSNTTAHLIADIEALREMRGVDRWTILGLSWGTTGRILPQEWDRFANAVPDHLRYLRLVDAYATMLADPDPTVRDNAAREWCTWEEAHVSLTPGHTPNPRYQDPEFRLRFARLVTHYWRHAAFLEEDQLIRDAAKLNGIPGVLIHGRYDVSGPLVTAWQLSQRWTTSRLRILDDAGHGGGKDFMRLVLSALNEFAIP